MSKYIGLIIATILFSWLMDSKKPQGILDISFFLILYGVVVYAIIEVYEKQFKKDREQEKLKKSLDGFEKESK